jgi:hypothetical protein
MTEAAAIVLPNPEKPLWRRAAAWLWLIGPFFFVSYGAANWLAAQRSEVGAIVFAWERWIPFVPWTIVPYWSIDAFYAVSLFVCTSKIELDTHARRLLTAQVGAVLCFMLFPLRFTFERPETSGLQGFLFAALRNFDKPFNQAPSLHIALICILWVLFERHTPRYLVRPMRLWFAVLAVSVLTTYQHHFIDVPTGALLGFLCLWLWPFGGVTSPLAGARLTGDVERLRLAACYAGGSAALAVPAFLSGGVALWLLWPAFVLAMVAANYAVFGAEGFQKSANGNMSFAALVLLWPYLRGAWIISRLSTRGEGGPSAIRDGVFIGRNPWPRPADGFAAVVDLCAELPGCPGSRAIPLLDLVTPPPARLSEAVSAIDEGRMRGSVLVCCASGSGRSGAAVAAWLFATGRAATVDEAIAEVRRARPRIVLDQAARAAIAQTALLRQQTRPPAAAAGFAAPIGGRATPKTS